MDVRRVSLAPLAAGSIGVLIMVRHGAPTSRLWLQVAALVVGALLSAAIAALGRERLLRVAPWAAGVGLALLVATFFTEGLQGVHRWIPLGPMSLHASSIAGPAILIGATALLSLGRWAWASALLFATEVAHLLQPDAGQATAFAAGGIAVLAGRSKAPPLARAIGMIALATTAAVTWTRSDPLAAVPMVEGIVRLAGDLGLPVKALAVATLGWLPLAVALAAGATEADDFAQAIAVGLMAYVAGIALVPIAGNFPVPVMGFGVSPILGVAICIGAAAAVKIRPRAPGSGS